MTRFKLILTPGQRPRKNNKYNRTKTFYDGIWFDSKLEVEHYKKLCLRQKALEIKALEVHKSYPLIINGIKVGKITPDFTFLENGVRKFHECKNPLTRALSGFRFKVFEALYGVEVEYVMKPKGRFIPFNGYESTKRSKRKRGITSGNDGRTNPDADQSGRGKEVHDPADGR